MIFFSIFFVNALREREGKEAFFMNLTISKSMR